MFAQVEGNHLALLDRLIGQFGRGEARVYRGTLAAKDRQTLDEGPVLATLRVQQQLFGGNAGSLTGPALTAVSMEQKKRFRLWQSQTTPGTTHADLVAPFGSSFGVTGECRGCLIDLVAPPETITFELVARGTFFNNTPLTIEARGSLTQVPAAALTYDDLYAANQAEVSHTNPLDSFARADGELRRLVERELSEKVPRPAAARYNNCARTTRYRMTEWFAPEHFTTYGVRDFAIVSAEICCVDYSNPGCHDPPRECF